MVRKQTARGLDEYRGFRHVVRNVYSFELEGERMKPLVRDLPRVFKCVRDDMETFCGFLRSCSSDHQ